MNLAEGMGVKLELVPTTWTTLLSDLTGGKFDVGMGGVSITLQRRYVAFFSPPATRAGKVAIAQCADNTLIFDELAAEQANVMITDSVEMRLQQRLHPGLCAIHPDQPFDFGELGYLLPRYVVVKQFVDQWLHIATESGVWTRLIQTYPGPSESSGRLGRRHIRVGGVR